MEKEKNQFKNVGTELTDEQLMQITGGASFFQGGEPAFKLFFPLYGVVPILKYGIIPTPKYGVIRPLYGVFPGI